MPTGRPSKQTQRAMAVVEQSRLRQYNARSDRLGQLMTQAGKATPLQKKIAETVVTRAGSVDAASLLHDWASEHIAAAHVTSNHNAYRTFSQLNSVLAMPMDDLTRADMTAWTAAEKQQYIRHESTLLEGTVGNIIRYTTTPLPQEEEKKPKGLLSWLLGE